MYLEFNHSLFWWTAEKETEEFKKLPQFQSHEKELTIMRQSAPHSVINIPHIFQIQTTSLCKILLIYGQGT